MNNKQAASQLTFSVDLLTQAARHIEFLEAVAEDQDLKNENVLRRAAYRYEKYWLPLAAEHTGEPLVAPRDIEWIWLCHMLSPKTYEMDCLSLVGTVVNHTFYSLQERQQRLQASENYWFQMYGADEEPFNLEQSTSNASILEDCTSSLSYDLVAAATRQTSFYEKLSSTGNTNVEDTGCILDRYKQFIYLCKLLPTLSFTPTIGIDLLWHTHQANPKAYKTDMGRILKRLLHHDDTSTDETAFNESINLTGSSWEKFYNESCLDNESCLVGSANMGTCYNRCSIK